MDDILFENVKYTADFFLMIPCSQYTGEQEDDIVLDMTGNLDAGVD